MVFQMKIQATPGSGAQQKIFTYVFPVMIFVIFNRLAAGLNLYYLCYNVLTALQQKMINSQIHREKEEREKEGGSIFAKKGESEGVKKKKKSLSSNGREKSREKGREAKKGRR